MRMHIFYFGQHRRLAVYGRARRINDTTNSGVARREQNVQRTRYVCFVSSKRIGHRARNRAERGFVEYYFHSADRVSHRCRIANVSANDLNFVFDFRQVFKLARAEVIQYSDAMAVSNETRCDVTAYKPGAASHQVEPLRHRSPSLFDKKVSERQAIYT